MRSDDDRERIMNFIKNAPAANSYDIILFREKQKIIEKDEFDSGSTKQEPETAKLRALYFDLGGEI